MLYIWIYRGKWWGKTSVIRLITGLNKISSGSVILFNEDDKN